MEPVAYDNGTTPRGKCYESKCGALMWRGDAVLVGSTENDRGVRMSPQAFVSMLADPSNPFAFLTDAEWAAMRETGLLALELAQASPDTWVVATQEGVGLTPLAV